MSLLDDYVKISGIKSPQNITDDLPQKVFSEDILKEISNENIANIKPITYEDSMLKQQADDITKCIQQQFNPQIKDIHTIANIAVKEAADAKHNSDKSNRIARFAIVLSIVSIIVDIILALVQLYL